MKKISNDKQVNLVRLIRAISQSVVSEVVDRPRVTHTLAGNVEDLDEALDVIQIRMDQETMGADPTQSDNYEYPGVIPAHRQGETFIDEQVRVTFDGPSGASAMRTSVESRIVLPFGTESGRHIVLDGEAGFIAFFDENDVLVGYMDETLWFTGVEGGLRAILDPFGGLRLRDEDDNTRVQVSSTEGLVVRDASTGISGLTARHDGLIVVDPVDGGRISIASGTTGAVPTPNWISQAETNPGTTHVAPALSGFGTGDDFALHFVCASAASDLGAQSYTPPASHTERSDLNDSGSGVTLASSVATQGGITNDVAATFTNTSSGWTRSNGHTVLVRGGGVSSPSFRSATTEVVVASTKAIPVTVDVPTGAVEGDVVMAFVGLAGASVPVGWTVPEGFVQLGLQVDGLGTSHVLGSGVWFSRVPASPPATYSFTLNMAAAGLTKVQVTAVVIQNPYAYPTGLDVRFNNRSMPRGQIASAVSSANTGAFTNATLPQTLETLSNVELLAGRTYEVSYGLPIYEFAALGAGCRVECAIQIDDNMPSGPGFINLKRTQRQMSAAGTERGEISISHDYVPTSDQTVDFRVRLTNSASGAGYTFQAFGIDDYKRELKVEDKGAVY